MSKGTGANKREVKKPKKEKVKVSATANSNTNKDGIKIAGKSAK